MPGAPNRPGVLQHQHVVRRHNKVRVINARTQVRDGVEDDSATTMDQQLL